MDLRGRGVNEDLARDKLLWKLFYKSRQTKYDDDMRKKEIRIDVKS